MRDYRHIQIICEGATEENFFKSVIKPYLGDRNPNVLHCKTTNLGGVGSTESVGYNKVKKHIVAEILAYINKERSIKRKAFFTTFIDYYRFPKAIPGYTFRELPDIYQMADDRQQALKKRLLSEPELSNILDFFEFEPFLMLHETETLVYVNLEKLNGIATTRKAIISELINQSLQVKNVEEINDNYHTSPSNRIERAFTNHGEVYHKSIHTPQVANAIGMPILVDACKHFNNWINALCNV